MSNQSSNPPYFDGLLERLASGDADAVAAFGRHVHWGYWPDPSEATSSPADYGAAAERLVHAISDMAGLGDGMRILDVGCGFGGAIASLNERLSDCQFVGVNIDARQLQRAADIARPRRGNSIQFVQSDATRIGLTDESFDVVMAVECVFHFNRRAFLGEAQRLLKRGGNLTLSDFVPSQRSLEYLDAVDLSADEGVRWTYGHVDLSCSLDRYRELARECGLELSKANDVTTQTAPTYAFLYALADSWSDPQDAELFRRSTRLLEKACRNGMIGYQLLRFNMKTPIMDP